MAFVSQRVRVLSALALALGAGSTASAAVVTWTGAGDGISWFDPRNWNNTLYTLLPNLVPQPGQDVIIPGNPNINIVGWATNLNSINAPGGARINVVGTDVLSVIGDIAGARVTTSGSFFVGGTFVGGQVTLRGGQVSSDLRLSSGSIVFESTAPVTFLCTGNTTLTGGTSPGQQVTHWATADAPSPTVTLVGNFVNAGTLVFTGSTPLGFTTLTVSGGTLTNTGLISFAQGTGSVGQAGARSIDGPLVNQGTLAVGVPTAFSRPGAELFNAGSVLLTAPLAMDPGTSLRQSSGGIDGGQWLEGRSISARFDSGVVNGSVVLVNSAATVSPTMVGAMELTFKGASTIVGSATLTPPQTITLMGDFVVGDATLAVQGDLITSGAVVLTSNSFGASAGLSAGTVAVNADGVLVSAQGSGGQRSINASVINAGLVSVDAETTFGPRAHVNSGQFNATRRLTLQSGASFRQNAGSVNVGSNFSCFGTAAEPARFTFNGGSLSGTPLLANAALSIGGAATQPATFELRGASTLEGNIAASQVINVTTNQQFPDASLTLLGDVVCAGRLSLFPADLGAGSQSLLGQGTLTLLNGSLLATQPGSGGARTIGVRTLTNLGVVQVASPTDFTGAFINNSGQFNLQAPARLLGSGQTFSMNAGTLATSNSAPLTGVNDTFVYNAGVILGVPQLTSSTLVLGPGGTGTLTFTLKGASTLRGNPGFNQLIQVVADPASGGDATLTLPQDTTNDGTIQLNALGSNLVSRLRLGTPGAPVTLTNGLGGTIVAVQGFGGTRGISGGSLINRGAINFNAPSTIADCAVTNFNSLAVSSPLTLDASNRSIAQESGQLLNATLITALGGAFTYNGGALIGDPTIANGRLTLGPNATSAVTFNLRGASALAGSPKAGQTVRSVGNAAFGNAIITVEGDVNSLGSILLQADAGFTSSMAVQGSLTNRGRLTIPALSSVVVAGGFEQTPEGLTETVYGSSIGGGVSAAGHVRLAGRFTGSFAPTFNPNCATALNLASGSSRLGQFSQTTFPTTGSGLPSQLLYSAEGATFVIVAPADVATSDGSPGADGLLNNGDFSLFFASFFAGCSSPGATPCAVADIANSAGQSGPDGQVNNGDFQSFFQFFFTGCQ